MLSLLFLFRVLIYSALVGEQQFQRKNHEGWLVDKTRKLSQIIQPFSCCFPHISFLSNKQKSPRCTSLSIHTWNAQKDIAVVPELWFFFFFFFYVWPPGGVGWLPWASIIQKNVFFVIYKYNTLIAHLSKSLFIVLRVWLAVRRYLSWLFACQASRAGTKR